MIARALRKGWAFFLRDLRSETRYRAAFLVKVGTLLSSLASVWLLGRYVDSLAPQPPGGERWGASYFAFAVVGVALADTMTVALQGFARSLRTAMVLGQLEAMLATPTHPAGIVAGSALYSFAFAGVRIAATLALGVALDPSSFAGAHWLAALGLVVLTALAAAAIGFVGAAVTLVFKRGESFTALAGALSVLLGGVLYPVSSLPAWLHPLAEALPLTHGLRAARAALLGRGAGEPVEAGFVWLGLMCAVAWPLAALALRAALRHVRQEGSLAVF